MSKHINSGGNIFEMGLHAESIGEEKGVSWSYSKLLLGSVQLMQFNKMLFDRVRVSELLNLIRLIKWTDPADQHCEFPG